MSTKQGKYKLASTKRWMEKETGNFTGSFLKTPPKASLYKVKVGKAKLDIIPFVAGKGNPNADEGMLWWERTFFVHRNIGPNQAVVICPARTLEKPCPICEARQRLLKQDEPEEADGLKPKEWVIVQLRDRNDKEKGIQLLPFSFHRFVDKVHEMANSGDADEKYDEFWHPRGGKLIRVNWGEDSAGDRGGKYVRAKTVIFEDRPDLKEETIDSGYCLDDLLIIMEYKKLKALYETGEGDGEGEDDEEEEEDDKPKKKKKKGAREDDEEESDDSESDDEESDDESDDEEDEDDKPKKKKKKASEDDEEDEEDSEDEEDEEEESPKKKKKKKASDDEDDEESEDEESEDEEDEKPKKKKKKASEDDEEDEDEDEEESDEEEDEKPKKKKKKASDEDDEEDAEDEESEDEEEEKPKSKKGKGKPSAKKNKGEPDEEGEGWDGFDSPDSEEGEDEESEDEEDEKPKKKKKKK